MQMFYAPAGFILTKITSSCSRCTKIPFSLLIRMRKNKNRRLFSVFVKFIWNFKTVNKFFFHLKYQADTYCVYVSHLCPTYPNILSHIKVQPLLLLCSITVFAILFA